MKINEIVQEGLGTGLLRIGKEVSKYFSPELADKLGRALAGAKPADPSEELQRLSDKLAEKARRRQNRISALDIYKSTKDTLGTVYPTPQSRISATKSIIQNLQRQGVLITDQPAPGRSYAPNPKQGAV
jgi:hypothetical protein